MPELRDQSFETLRTDGAFDVVVVGGGINGIGVFRELALQGLRVLLVERNDFCSGCSAAPSRMIHGGLRYLENGEFDLVRESLTERDALLRNAPHMVRPLPTAIPITSMFSGLMNGAAGFLGLTSKPAPRGALPVKIGLGLYDWVSRKRRLLPRHRFLSAAETFRKWPKLTRQLRYAAIYHDAWISHPERLGIELIRDTCRMAPEAIALNYADLAPDGSGFVVTDQRSGTQYPVTAKVLVNATGAWLDDALDELARRPEGTERLVSGTKGSHVIVNNRELHDALNGHMVFFDNSDGRVCIVFPYLGKVLAGSTDIRVEKAGRVRCEDEERDYILASLRLVFPEIEVTADQAVYSYSGIRPLPKSDHDFTGRISRGHFVQRIDAEIPHFCMVGGKWTTFRAFAQQAAEAVLDTLGRTRIADTLDLPIGGGKDFPGTPELETRLIEKYAISPARAAHLADAYGTLAFEVMEFCSAHADDRPLGKGTKLTVAEIAFLVRREHVARLADIVLRRTSLAITGLIDSGLIEAVARAAGAELGWDDDRRNAEIESLVSELETYHGVCRMTLDRRNNERNAQCA